MKKNRQKNLALVALILASYGASASTSSVEPVNVKNQISIVRQIIQENMEDVKDNPNLKNYIPQPDMEESLGWRKTWNNTPTFGDAFGDFWG